ncbi:MAG: thioredoxin domain-containing protein [Sulfurimonas sp.]|uniref:thioredoxin domain-containing protein n=1 Tax=Sulfurimonas sp. TaxID=2022749 RepID=UPI00262C4796|nr:thioredoxin domain-containing protein [Sulfurimonas sp.]MCW8894971.1 thioredoxin domain-containing protein [Sulfurimonas sp.]MCW8953530.1 thioredoxin domain-containing protein [Sulfurimonas sp.]
MSNRLEKEDSPYLQQHKNNPVDWFPWCDEAFQKAEDENKAIFISIGYSSCHWCHVMEETVFENQECADILNEHFVSIKVDREERPDIDKHYQEVHMLLNRRPGGWPTSIFCTPQNKPFFAGTYIPPESKQGSIEGMGFKELTRLIGEKISQNDEQLYKNADEVEGFLNHEEHPKEATVLKEDFVKNFMLQVKNNYETKDGGFSVAPKFPHASTLGTLLTIDKLYDDKAAKAMLTHTLNSMKKGGMYDLVDGGFCRYSVDNEWIVPHFEKMLYDNALLCELYTNSYLTYKDEAHLHVAKEIADFWHNFMSEDDLFYSASDADSEGEEGTYFTYTYDEVYKILKQNDYENIEDILKSLSVTKDGNFEGKNIIRFEEGQIPKDFDNIKILLSSIRSKREYPFVDRKVQTSWSSMMIKALFSLGNISKNYKQRGIDSLNALLNTMYIDGKLYHTTLIHKTPKIEAFLEDYAYLSQALISAYTATSEEVYLIRAQHLTNIALEKFYKNGTWKFSIGEFETKADIADNTYTSSVSIMIDVLISLTTLLEDDKYTHFAFKTLEYNSYELGRRPVIYPYMLKQTLRYLKGDRIIKSTKNNIEANSFELASLKYPFILKKSTDDTDYMICGSKSCFANTDSINKINDIISNTF